MRAFATSEITLPTGDYKGELFREEFQPFSRLWFDLHEHPLPGIRRFAVVGPTQTGKTLLCTAIPALYHLFECQNDIVIGLPSMDMASDKWQRDLLPVIEGTRYRDFLPLSGPGSRGGSPVSIKFLNGVELRFMGAGGSSTQLAGYTAPVVICTEVDGWDEAAAGSDEADKVSLIEGRARAFLSSPLYRIYLECTTTTKDGRIWTEYTNGTESRIVLPCPRCQAWVSPEREHLVGWQDAENILEARERAAFACPSCGSPWAEHERLDANQRAKLIHRGQTIGHDGIIIGPIPPVDTIGFRWSAVHNTFAHAADVAADEWRAARITKEAEQENAEKKLCQMVWARPWEPKNIEEISLDPKDLVSRVAGLRRGICPADSTALAIGVDIGQRIIHWTVAAWRATHQGHILDYAAGDTDADNVGIERGILLALRNFRDLAMTGYPVEGKATPMIPRLVWIDSRFRRAEILQFCRESNAEYGGSDPSTAIFWPTMGYGETQSLAYRRYTAPTKKSKDVRFLGEGYHIARTGPERALTVEMNADYWKIWLHRRLACPETEPGSIAFFMGGSKNAHISFVHHLTAEREIEEFIAGKGLVRRMIRERRSNHWLDSTALAFAALHRLGARLTDEDAPIIESKPVSLREYYASKRGDT